MCKKGLEHPDISLVCYVLAGVKGMYESRALNWVYRRRALDEMCEMIAPKGQPTVVGFGVVRSAGEETGVGPVVSGQAPDNVSSGQSPGSETDRQTGQGAGRPGPSGCGPGWSPYEEICDRLRHQPGVTLIEIDERGCEMTCNSCWNTLSVMHAMSTVLDAKDPSKRSMQMTDVHCLLLCKHISGEGKKLMRCGGPFERGANAAKNVLMLTQCHIDGGDRPLPFR